MDGLFGYNVKKKDGDLHSCQVYHVLLLLLRHITLSNPLDNNVESNQIGFILLVIIPLPRPRPPRPPYEPAGSVACGGLRHP